jgi:hypothetical protein
MGTTSLWTIVLPVCLIVGCSSASDPEQKPPQKTVFDGLVGTEQRARDVQKTVNENAERARKATDSQERGDSSP